MNKRIFAIAAVALCITAAVLIETAAAGTVSYQPHRGDGCGRPSFDGATWANFVVFSNRICGSYPWDPQRMMASGSVGLYNRTREARHLVAWSTSRSKRWNLDRWVRPDEVVQRSLNRPGLYLFRDRAHSKLVRSGGALKCLGACGYLRVTY
jgi:hypothetical protein